MARIFQDSAGTTPVTTYDQPVGKIVRGAGTVDLVQSVSGSRPTMARWPRGGSKNEVYWTEDATLWETPWPTSQDGVITMGGEPDDNPYSRFYRQYPGRLNKLYYDYLPNRKIYRSFEFAPMDDLRYVGLGSTMRYEWWDIVNNNFPWSARPRTEYRNVTVLEDGWFKYEHIIEAASIAADQRETILIFGEENPIPTGGFNQPSPNPGGSRLLVRRPVVQIINDFRSLGDVAPYQKVTTANDVTEEGVESLWHLYNDGGDSLQTAAPVPAGTYGYAWIDPYGEITFDTRTSDGINPVVVADDPGRYLDIILREGDFSAGEKVAITDYWERRYK